MTRLVSLLAVSQLALLAPPAHAEDAAAGEALFQEGRRLMAEGQIAAGCEKLKESFAADPMSGTMLNLADCYEKQGRIATAWARFQNAASLAKSQGKAEQAAEANRRMKQLEAQLSYLTIQVPEAVPGLEVRRDDLEVSPAMFGAAVPVDPGNIVVVASAAGYRTVKLNVEVGSKHDKKSLTIPKLEKLEHGEAAESAGANALAEEPPAEEKTKPGAGADKPRARKPPPIAPLQFPKGEPVSDVNYGALALGGAGLIIAGVGGVFGYWATQSNHDAEYLCPTRHDCSQKALDSAKTRDDRAMVANIGVGVGVAAVAGAALWLVLGSSSNDRESARITLQPTVAPGAAGLSAATRF